nr:RecName: Full=96 kDa cell wall protein [Arabidopsis thaliana]
AVREYHWFVE